MRKKRTRQLLKQSRAPLRKEALESIRALKEQGHSLETISAQLIHPSVGKSGAAKKKSLRDAMAQKLQKNKAQAKAKPKAKAKGSEKRSSSLPQKGGSSVGSAGETQIRFEAVTPPNRVGFGTNPTARAVDVDTGFGIDCDD